MSNQDNLLKYARLDQHHRALKADLDAASLRRQTAEDALAEASKEIETIEVKLDERRRHAEAWEMAGKDIAERIAKLRESMNNARTNEDYQQFLTEVNQFDEQRQHAESMSLRCLEQVEDNTTRQTELNAQCDTLRQQIDVAMQDETQARADIAEGLTRVEQEIAEAAQELPADTVELYHKLIDVLDGDAVSTVEEVSRRYREYMCNGCHMEVPFQTVAHLLTDPVAPTECPNCSCLLVLQPELRESLSAKE